MSERFDPYQAWLGVPRSAQPSYYQLLGLPNFESEPPVIAEAAELALAKVAAHRKGPQAEAAERVLGKLKAARDVLLSSEKRQAYDQQLRSHLGIPAVPPASPAGPVEAVDSPTMMLPPGALPPLSAGGFPPAGAMPPGYAGAAGFAAPQGYAAPGFTPPGFGAPPSPYGQVPGFPSQAPGFPPQNFPPQGPGVPPQAAGFPQGPGYPPQAGFAPQQNFAPQGGFAPAADPYAPTGAPQEPGAFVPFSGLSQALGNAPAPAPPIGGPHAHSPMMPPMAPPMSPAMAPPMSGPAMGPPGMGGPSAPPRGADPNFAPRQSTSALRRGAQRRQQNSTFLVAIGVLGGAVALLIVAMIAANKNDDKQARNEAPPSAPVAPQPQSSPTHPVQPGLGISFLKPDSVRVDPSFDAGNSRNMGSSPNSNGPGPSSAMPNQPSNDDLIKSLIPGSYKPSPATPMASATMPEAMPGASPTGSKPTAKPAGSAAAGPAPKPTPVTIAGTPTGAPAMEASIAADAARAQTVHTMSKSVKASLKTRDYAKAEDVALQSLVLADAPELVTMTYEQHRAIELLVALWNGVREGVKGLKPGDEITFNGKTAQVVRRDETTLVVTQDNKPFPLTINKLVPELAIQLAERTLPADDATTKLAAGVFLMVDGTGDKEKGRALINEAAAKGAEVDKLLAWLDMPE